MQRRGLVVGTRHKNGRMVYLYMLDNLFAEIIYKHDIPSFNPERVVLLDGLQNLNRYLEAELRR